MVVTDIEESSIALTYQVKATIRWTAPELLNIREPESEDESLGKIFPTVESDIYSFAGIMLYVGVYCTLSCASEWAMLISIAASLRDAFFFDRP